MLLLKGTRTVRIKTWQDHAHQCDACKDFNLSIGIYMKYFHIFFIPIAALGVKSTKMYCASCGQPVRIDSVSREYEKRTKTPFYLYSGMILVGLLIAAGFVLNASGAHQRDQYIDHPQVGDVYLVKRDLPLQSTWYFLRIVKIHGDTAVTNHSNLEYNTYVYKFNSDDYFVSGEESEYPTALLKTMFQKGVIVNIFRDYEDTGFGRVK